MAPPKPNAVAPASCLAFRPAFLSLSEVDKFWSKEKRYSAGQVHLLLNQQQELLKNPETPRQHAATNLVTEGGAAYANLIRLALKLKTPETAQVGSETDF